VGGANQGPLGTHLLNTAQQELAEAACLLDLSEHRLDDLFPQPVAASPTRPLELSSHGLGERPADLALGLVGVFGATCGDVGGNAALVERSKVRLTQVAAVGGGFFGLAPEVLLDPVNERYDLTVVAPWSRAPGLSV
jgi:hypothetical protein